MTTYIGMSGPVTVLRIKLTEVLSVPRVRQWFSILCRHAGASRVVDLGHPKGTSQPGESLLAPSQESTHRSTRSFTWNSLLHNAGALSGVVCFYHRVSSLLIDEVDIFTPELVLPGFIICLDMEGACGDLRGEDGLSPVHQEERSLSGCPTG
jgi:hypothetical protein